MDSSDITKLREKIDTLDQSIIELLGSRFVLTRQIGAIKSDGGWPVQDHERETAQFQKLAKLAQEHAVPEQLVLIIYRNIIDTVLQEHRQHQSGDEL